VSSVYLETSALLAWLLGEPDGNRVISSLDAADLVATSRLSLLEAKRSLIRLENAKTLKPAQRQKLIGLLEQISAGWMLVEIIPEIQARAAETFPAEPIRTLDAIHLATALELLKVFPDLKILSFDQRILSNMEPLGLS
jgi:predicted nucleic acid-binding protein